MNQDPNDLSDRQAFGWCLVKMAMQVALVILLLVLLIMVLAHVL